MDDFMGFLSEAFSFWVGRPSRGGALRPCKAHAATALPSKWLIDKGTASRV
jgi:hypothetical protein